MSSLKDQLLAAGLTDKQSHKNARKKKQPKAAKKDRGKLTESARLADQARSTKTIRDKELNHQRQLELDKKARFAQVKQLVENSKIDRMDADVAYSFSFDKKIKQLYVTLEQQTLLSRGQICIVCLSADNFELVPKIVAEKIAQRDDAYVIQNLETESDHTDGDDPYADYKIPDDLIW